MNNIQVHTRRLVHLYIVAFAANAFIALNAHRLPGVWVIGSLSTVVFIFIVVRAKIKMEIYKENI